MKTIFKFIILALVFPIVFQACRDDEFTLGEKEPSFELYNTTLASNVLYPTMENNSFRLVWDNSLGGGNSYVVELSSVEDFSTKVELGSSDTTSLTTTIGALNEAAIGAGLHPYESQKVFFRVVSGSNVSNVISTDLTTYPTAKPVITSPSAGAEFVLDIKAPEEIATTVTWSDYAYGTKVDYLVEVALAGSTDYVAAGTVADATSLDLTNKVLNDALMKLGLSPDVAAEVELRVSANTSSVGGTLLAVSAPVGITVTPYVAYKDLFFVGEAVEAGWSTNNNNHPLYRDSQNTNKFYYTGYFNAGGFKVLEQLGDNTWHPQWGVTNGVVHASNPDATNEPGTFVIPTAGFYTFELDILEKTYSIEAYTGAQKTYPVMGVIGNSTPLGWDAQTAMVNSTFDVHQWSLTDVSLSVGEIKFRANDKWDDSWGSSNPISGEGLYGGPNIPVNEAGVYDIFFNDLDGRYILIKK
ncbi:SusE domain-containing protein [Chryseobacterium sp. A301]